VLFRNYNDGEVTRRLYHDAPAADRDMICVAFIIREAVWIPRENVPVFPTILVLMRKDLSKIYINQIYIGAQGYS
jgi:hypothetical protein